MSNLSAQDSRPHIVILGGGFAGLYAARTFNREPVRVTMVDRENYHLFQPLLYQVATAGLNPSDIARPLRSILRRQKNVSVLLADARDIRTEDNCLILANGKLSYDYLIVATGATHSYFGKTEWEANAPGLKTIEDALEIRRRIYLAYEAAELEPDPGRRKEWLTFIVVGGGPTGVELAGALAEIGRHTLAHDFNSFDPKQIRVVLIEGNDRVLTTFPEDLSSKAVRQLESIGVEVITSTCVDFIDDRCVASGDWKLAARTILWAAGVTASRIASSLNVPCDRSGRVAVLPDLSLPDTSSVFVAGDVACIITEDGQVPGVAPAAMQAGAHAAQNIMRLVRGDQTIPFQYRDKGSIATIGRAAAVADLGRFRFSGFPAWATWLAIHIFYLIGFKNRLWVLLGWAWSYLTYQRGARLITGRHDYEKLPDPSGKSNDPVERELHGEAVISTNLSSGDTDSPRGEKGSEST